jgi:hypothetical protein
LVEATGLSVDRARGADREDSGGAGREARLFED